MRRDSNKKIGAFIIFLFYLSLHTKTHTHTHARARIYIYIYMCVYIYVCIHYPHTHIYTHRLISHTHSSHLASYVYHLLLTPLPPTRTYPHTNILPSYPFSFRVCDRKYCVSIFVNISYFYFLFPPIS